MFAGRLAAVPGRGRYRPAVGVAGPRLVWEGNWLHCLNEVEFLLHRVVMRTLGLHQAIVDIPAREIYGRLGRSFWGRGRARDWRIECTAQIANWDEGGAEVGSKAESSAAYLMWYRRAYQERLQLGRPYPVSFNFSISLIILFMSCWIN